MFFLTLIIVVQLGKRKYMFPFFTERYRKLKGLSHIESLQPIRLSMGSGNAVIFTCIESARDLKRQLPEYSALIDIISKPLNYYKNCKN
ncbi:hypothetical protein AM500_07835 [Bacillus sp. FJAT-18017]|nr:hypothetical protein AM500_07835 [Bacillus sp. FJAT-18017]